LNTPTLAPPNRRRGSAALYVAIALDCVCGLFFGTFATLNAVESVHYFSGADSASGVASLALMLAEAGIACIAFASALLLYRRRVAGASLSYFVAVAAFFFATTGASQRGEPATWAPLLVGAVVLFACVVARSTRYAIAPPTRAPAAPMARDLASPSAPPPLVLSASPGDRALTVLVGPALVAGGVSVALSGQLLGWAAVAVFGAVTVSGLVQWSRGTPRLTASQLGLTLTGIARSKTYPWALVSPFKVVNVSRNLRRVGFNVAPTSGRDLETVSINRALVGIDKRLPTNFGMKPRELADLLNQWRDWAAR
jgi:hypothetical protein